MPRYDFYCEQCKQETEIVRAFTDNKEILCNDCGSALIKKISATPVHFRGSGFYSTDNG